MKMHPIEKAGAYLTIVGGALLAGVFVIVMFNGAWPDIFLPLKSLFGFFGDWLGDAAIIVEGLLFLGPGILLQMFGRKVREDNERMERWKQ